MPAVATPHAGSRVLRGLGSLTLLLLTVVGVPAALIALGGDPLPANLTWDGVRDALMTPDDGTIMIGLVTILGWAAWLVFAISVISELIAIASRQRLRISLPGLAGPQRLAAGLLISVITMTASPQLSPAAPSPPTAATTVRPSTPEPAVPTPDSPPRPVRPSLPAAGQAGDAGPAHVHRVQPGDDLWSLAEEFYGKGQDWRRIAAANPDLLTGGPDRLQVGWRLIIPDAAATPARTPGEHTVTVRRGDTLSAIAERELGAATRWTEIFRANRALLNDPDELTPGSRLVLPAAETDAEQAAEPERPRRAEPDDRTPRAEPTEPRPTAQAQPTASPTPPATPPTATPAPATPPTATPASASAEPTAAAPPAEPTAAPPTAGAGDDGSVLDVVLPLAAVGGLLAAGLVEGLAWRRRVQLQARPKGRRLPHPPAATGPIAVALGRRQRPLNLRTLDKAMRAIAAHCRNTKTTPPPLQLAMVADDQIELVMSEAVTDVPVGFGVRGRSWLLHRDDAGYLSSMPGLADSPRPWPALVTLGRDDRGRQVLADLESLRLLALVPSPALDAAAVLAAMAVELSFSPWADEMILTLVGSAERLPEALGKHNVALSDDLDALLDRLELRAAVQRDHHPHANLGAHRIDPDLADPWAPEVILINVPMRADQERRLIAVLDSEPRVTMAAVVVGSAAGAPWTLHADDDSAESQALLLPAGLALTPQLLDAPEMDAVVDLVRTSGSEETTPAPWWWTATEPPDPPPDNVTYLGRRGYEAGTAEPEGRAIMAATAMSNGSVDHPTLQLLGPLELVGAAGTEPGRAAKQCLEYCAWLLQNPGTTAQAMMAGLAVAEGTRRSNMSRLRNWLGTSPDGEAYLPDAYTGRIVLHPTVSSDWQLVQMLTAAGVNRASDGSLRAALGLVRGAPLADAAPGQWHWAEELRTDMVSCIRDIGAELADRAVLAGDVDLARWAAARALVAAPGDELLLTTRIRTEHLAGNGPETERLARHLAAQARTLGVDLNPETVTVLQQVMEGRVRARLA